MVPGLLLTSIRVPIILHCCWWFAYLSLPLKLEVLWDAVECSTWELRSGYGVRPVFASLLHRYCVTVGKFLHFLCLSFYSWKTGIGTVPVFIKVCVLGDPIVHLKVWLFMNEEDSQDSAYNSTLCYHLLWWKDPKHNPQREEEYGAKPGGNQARASKSLLPVELHRTHLALPAKICDNTGKMSTREAR